MNVPQKYRMILYRKKAYQSFDYLFFSQSSYSYNKKPW